jgi:predicted nucleotidyltransferase
MPSGPGFRLDTVWAIQYSRRPRDGLASFSSLGLVWVRLHSRVRSLVVDSVRPSFFVARRAQNVLPVSIIGLALYGSRARGDHDQDSDVDLLAITDDSGPRTISAAGTTISCRPHDVVLRRAALGDLFVLNLVSEAVILYEAWPIFEELQQAFRYRDNYDREIGLASDVGWFLLRNAAAFDDAGLLNRKMAWCARTIVTARAANEQRPIFSVGRLADFSGSPELLAVVKNKHRRTIDGAVFHAFQAFLESMGAKESEIARTIEEQRRLFAANRNIAGLRILDALNSQQLVSEPCGDPPASIY